MTDVQKEGLLEDQTLPSPDFENIKRKENPPQINRQATRLRILTFLADSFEAGNGLPDLNQLAGKSTILKKEPNPNLLREPLEAQKRVETDEQIKELVTRIETALDVFPELKLKRIKNAIDKIRTGIIKMPVTIVGNDDIKT